MEYVKIHINKYIDCMVSDSRNCDSLATGSDHHSSEEIDMHRNKKMYPVLNYRDLREHFD
jgi:hypothetical protein